ncbi:hypothetical protein ACLMJK_002803 [Lecanora helva]
MSPEDTPTEPPIGTSIHASGQEPLVSYKRPEQMSGSLKNLVDAWSSQEAPFCCGGNIPIVDSTTHSSRFEKLTYDDDQATSPPIVLRWDSPGGGDPVQKLTLPLSKEEESAVESLVNQCEPATFGKGGDEVLDESYRKAVKLDNDRFSTNFNPYDVGIIEAINQSLLPGVAKTFADGKSVFEDHLGVVAELYKLNVYSGPSGRFRAHVDTPRGARQFGSLVVCLPYAHDGGHLKVVHQGRETIFDWNQNSAGAIQWAAFYSDCEHEVLEVKSGHRITLTYNLYVQERVGSLLRKHATVDSRQFDIYNRASEALKAADFLPRGGILGFYCRHAYAHSSNTHRNRLPYALKGLDAIFYSVFHRLGFNVRVKPIIFDNDIKGDREDYLIDNKGKDIDIWADLEGTKFHDIQISPYADDENRLFEASRVVNPFVRFTEYQ